MKRCLLLLCWLCWSTLVSGADQLDPALAFRPSLNARDKQTAEVQLDISDGAYLYRHRFAFKPLTPGVELGKPQFPAGQAKHDENFGQVEIYRGTVRIPIPLQAGRADSSLKLAVTYQGCADVGVCYPPETRELTLGGAALLSGAQSERKSSLLLDPEASTAAPSQLAPAFSTAPALTPRPAPSATPEKHSADPDAGSLGALTKLLKGGNLALILISFFGAGLLLAFTPCMLPMLPILSGIVIGHDPAVGRKHAVGLACVYVLGMALTYALIGVAAGLSGTWLKTALQNPWVLGSFALLFVALAGAMFGFYEMQLPSALQSRLSNAANRQRGGHFFGVAVMGVLSALIVGPCMAAPLAGALLYIAKTGDGVVGGLAMFALGLGSGAPLVLVLTAAREILPKTGPWMEAIRKIFGVIMLGLAIWLVAPVVPAAAVMLAWAVLAIVSAIYLHALDPLPPHAQGWHRFWKGIGFVALLWGTALIVGVLGGARDPLEPLGFLRSAAGETPALRFEKVANVADLERRLSEGRPVMLDFYADSCTSCKEMEREAFRDPRVLSALNGTTLLRADLSQDTAEDHALLKRFGLFAPPAIVFFDAQGREQQEVRVYAKQDADTFLATVLQRAE